MTYAKPMVSNFSNVLVLVLIAQGILQLVEIIIIKLKELILECSFIIAYESQT